MAYRLDHLVIVAADLERALAEHGARFGRGPDWRASSDGTETAEWRTRTGAVEVLVPPSAAALEPASTGPKSLALGVDDLGVCATEANPGALLSAAPVGVAEPPPMASHGGEPAPCRDPRSAALPNPLLWRRLLESARADLLAAGLEPGPIARAEAFDARTGARRAWARLRCADAALGGLKLFVLQRDEALVPPEGPDLAEIELRTSDRDALERLLGGALGLARREQGAFDLGGISLAVHDAASEPKGAASHRIAGYRLDSEPASTLHRSAAER